MTELKIGRRIQRLRKEKKLTQDQMAAALGVSAGAVSKWETELSYPDITLLAPLSRLLGVSVDVLLDFHQALTPMECEALLIEVRQNFENHEVKKAMEAGKQLLREYPSELYLTFRLASCCMVYMASATEESLIKEQLAWARELFERSCQSEDQTVREASCLSLSSIYMTQGETDLALGILDQIPTPKTDPRLVKISILTVREETEAAETLSQECLMENVNNAGLCLASMLNQAKNAGDPVKALHLADMAIDMLSIFGMAARSDENSCGADAIFHFSKAELLSREGRREEALDELEAFAGSYLGMLESKGEQKWTLPWFDRLSWKKNNLDGTYLKENARRLLFQSEDMETLRDTARYQDILRMFSSFASDSGKIS